MRELESGKGMAELCREHELHPSLVSKWRLQWQDNPGLAFSGRGNVSTSSAKIAELERRNISVNHEAYQNIQRFIEDVYNQKRLHSFIGYKTPNEYEKEVITQNIKLPT